MPRTLKHLQGSIQAALDSAYDKFKDLKEGKNADYIPALAKVDPNIYGIALVTADGRVYTTGDVTSEVSIQSISKVFTMAKVIEEQGPTRSPTTSASMPPARCSTRSSRSSSTRAREMNPLVNPGAITATSMVSGVLARRDLEQDPRATTATSPAGRSSVNQEVFKSEADTNQRNQAIGELMYAYGHIKANPDQATDIYTEQCSVNVNAKDLATMAATLANGGTNPVTGKAGAAIAKYVPEVLAVMATAGLYDDSRQVAATRPACRPRAASAAASSPWRPGKFGIAVDLAAARRGRQQRQGAEGHRRHLQRARCQSVRRDADGMKKK